MGRLAPRGDSEPRNWLTASPLEVSAQFARIMYGNAPWQLIYGTWPGEEKGNAEDR